MTENIFKIVNKIDKSVAIKKTLHPLYKLKAANSRTDSIPLELAPPPTLQIRLRPQTAMFA
jgi:hypothetical protein